ncbi:MAG: S1/P1 nuclease [Azospira sp.]|nr:S1/P1 nuclease [Azospira sp.]
MKLRPALAILGLLLTASLPAAAWNAAGHRLTAQFAWSEMAPATRSALTRLLAAHPDHARWQAKAGKNRPADDGLVALLAASTWPDDIKRDRRFHDDDKAATPPRTAALPGFPDMARHRRWHYADHRLADGARTGRGELDRRLPELLRTLGDAKAPLAARSHALPWIIHLVADAHQPLHAASRHDEDGRGDGGGNALWVETPQHPRLREMSLHAYWDDLPGPPWLRGKALETATAALRAIPVAIPHDESADDVSLWLEESLGLARDLAYAGLDGFTPSIDARYHERAQGAARKRLAQAGRRLARLLDALLGEREGHVSRGTAVSRETR